MDDEDLRFSSYYPSKPKKRQSVAELADLVINEYAKIIHDDIIPKEPQADTHMDYVEILDPKKFYIPYVQPMKLPNKQTQWSPRKSVYLSDMRRLTLADLRPNRLSMRSAKSSFYMSDPCDLLHPPEEAEAGAEAVSNPVVFLTGDNLIELEGPKHSASQELQPLALLSQLSTEREASEVVSQTLLVNFANEEDHLGSRVSHFHIFGEKHLEESDEDEEGPLLPSVSTLSPMTPMSPLVSNDNLNLLAEDDDEIGDGGFTFSQKSSSSKIGEQKKLKWGKNKVTPSED